jgi:hypothetical protein
VAFVVHEAHVYFYRSHRVCRALSVRREVPYDKLRREPGSSDTPPADTWKPWEYTLAPGHFHVPEDDLPAVRAWFLKSGRSPKCILKDQMRLKSLVYNLSRKDPARGTVVVHGLPPEAAEIQAWLAQLNLGMEYKGEGLPAISMKVLHRLLRHRERVYLTGEQKAELLEAHDYRCALCDRRSSAFEYDHIDRFSESFGEQRFQPLCPECHRVKTDLESKTFDSDPLASHFERGVWDAYVASPRQPPLVYKAKGGADVSECEIADVRRCRKRVLEFNPFPIPIFCPLDEIQDRSTPELGD